MSRQPRYRKGDTIGNRYLVHQALKGSMGEVYLCLSLKEDVPSFWERFIVGTIFVCIKSS